MITNRVVWNRLLKDPPNKAEKLVELLQGQGLRVRMYIYRNPLAEVADAKTKHAVVSAVFTDIHEHTKTQSQPVILVTTSGRAKAGYVIVDGCVCEDDGKNGGEFVYFRDARYGLPYREAKETFLQILNPSFQECLYLLNPESKSEQSTSPSLSL